MKIVMIGHKYVPSREGGVEVVVENLSALLVEKGHEVTLFNRKRKRYPTFTQHKGCKIETVFTVNKKSLDAIVYAFFATLKVRKLIKKRKVDVVHFHAEGPCFFLNLLPKNHKEKYGAKVVVTIHGLDWQRGKWGGFARKILKVGEKRAVKYADEIIVLSENNRKYFLETYNRETQYIPNGVDLPNMLPAKLIKEKYGLVKDSYILFLARMVPEKGLHYLVDAWKKVVEKTGTDKKLVIAGGASNSREYFEKIYESVRGDDTVIMTGYIQGQELQEMYSNAYLYVLPSDIEGMAMSLLEALSYGNVCLVSDIPENTEVINAGNFVFKHGNTDDLYEQIEKILRLNLSTHVNSVVSYTWQEVTEQTLETYKR
ncbi:MAG: glycosyltransferase family 4 protein [Clostridia bacterium]|nr:glycosyltransferase family 4 protein [Clostridia bacterium]